ARKGIRLTYGRDTDLMQTISAGDAMTPVENQVVRADLPATALETEFEKTNTHGLIVVDRAGKLHGIVSLQDLSRAKLDGTLEGRTVNDICTHDVLTVTASDRISVALRLIGRR